MADAEPFATVLTRLAGDVVASVAASISVSPVVTSMDRARHRAGALPSTLSLVDRREGFASRPRSRAPRQSRRPPALTVDAAVATHRARGATPKRRARGATSTRRRSPVSDDPRSIRVAGAASPRFGPRTVRVVAAASPVAAAAPRYPSRTTRLRGLSASRPRRRRDAPVEYRGVAATRRRFPRGLGRFAV